MKKLQWNMEEVFYFPENIGVPKDARVVKVKAGFTEKRSEDAVRLSGIYHITAKLDFTEGQRSEEFPSEAVFVDDVELEGNTGYFEYAVPLYIDLPPEIDHPLHIEASDVQSTFDGQGAFTVAWNVKCMYGDAAVAGNETANNETETVSTVTARTETDSTTEKMEKAAVPEVQKETVAVPEVQKETVAVEGREHSEEVVSAASQSTTVQKRSTAAPVQETQSAAMQDSTSNGQDDILSYIAALPDEWTTSRFRSNDIFVKEES